MAHLQQGVQPGDIVRFLHHHRGFLDNFVNTHVQATRLENWLNEKILEEHSSERNEDEESAAFQRCEEGNHNAPSSPRFARSVSGYGMSCMKRCKILKKYGIRRTCQHRPCLMGARPACSKSNVHVSRP